MPSSGCVERKRQPRALAAADPVRLHQPHALGPAIQRVQRVQQFLRVVGDLQEPLAELLLLHQRAGAPAAAVDHLLVRQHGAIDRIPVDPALLALDQAGAQEIQEQLLLMAVIFRIAGGELALPLERQPHALQLGAHGGDVLAGPLRRMDAALARRVLGRQAERVPAHRMHHREAARPLVARHHVAQRVVAHVAHVDLPAGIREHLQHVVFRLVVGRHVRHAEAAALGPGALPARFGLAEVVARRLGRDGRGIGQAFGHRYFIGRSPRLYPSQPPPAQEAGECDSGSAWKVAHGVPSTSPRRRSLEPSTRGHGSMRSRAYAGMTQTRKPQECASLRQLLASDCSRSSRARDSTLFSISPTVTGLTG